MNPISASLKITAVAVLCAITTGATSRATATTAAAQTNAQPAACAAPEYHQLDFWIGDWDAYDIGDPQKPVARTHVDRLLNGCVLKENYQGVNGGDGQSFSIYDSTRKLWHQSWVTNRGKLLIIEGQFQDGEMVLSGTDYFTTNHPIIRGTWKLDPAEKGVRETAVTSTDGGSTWQPLFDLIFRPHDPAPPAPNANASTNDDQKAVAALDTEYQAAVKINDAATMARLLADDYTLVIGSGKTFTKSDLVDEARSGRIVYEHQEDTQQTVRVWGDTAVVTAKLWEKGTEAGKPFDYTTWSSDTYVRTPTGWRYVFAQSSLPLPKSSPQSN
jgi:ketosteroid isomerase-like protein